ncbi:MAG: glycosyltransferase [Luteolibacter sp.]|uniref:glycosyltransferase n=1 Tax=Luteolibacter sp. TaxID=1962973 RepID=UPI0032652CF6
MSEPLISVIMPVWNGEAHLREAIESILQQTERNFEFLIIDDGSTDGTVSIIESYQDPRIRLIRQEHEGIVVALNRGVAEAGADLIARMDADDIAYPERLKRQVDIMRKEPGVVLCHTQIRIIGEERYVTPAGRLVRSEGLTLLRLCYQSPIVHPTVMFRKDAFLTAGGYLAEERHAEDYGLWGRLVHQGPVVGLPVPLLDFRVHQASISKRKAEVQLSLSRDIALRHCRDFMRLDPEEAERALEALYYGSSQSTRRDWFWLMAHCLPRLRKQGIELWMWAFQKTIWRVLHR